jgi:protein-S-isoprenylcysteine O-methyltransferase Ste14
MLWQVISSIASAVAALAAFITAIIMAYQSRLMRQSTSVDVRASSLVLSIGVIEIA